MPKQKYRTLIQGQKAVDRGLQFCMECRAVHLIHPAARAGLAQPRPPSQQRVRRKLNNKQRLQVGLNLQRKIKRRVLPEPTFYFFNESLKIVKLKQESPERQLRRPSRSPSPSFRANPISAENDSRAVSFSFKNQQNKLPQNEQDQKREEQTELQQTKQPSVPESFAEQLPVHRQFPDSQHRNHLTRSHDFQKRYLSSDNPQTSQFQIKEEVDQKLLVIQYPYQLTTNSFTFQSEIISFKPLSDCILKAVILTPVLDSSSDKQYFLFHFSTPEQKIKSRRYSVNRKVAGSNRPIINLREQINLKKEELLTLELSSEQACRMAGAVRADDSSLSSSSQVSILIGLLIKTSQ